MTPEIIALIIFTLTYLLFISDMTHKTVAALIGAMLMVVYGIVEYDTISHLIDWKTLTVVLGIFVTINVVEMSGLFEYLSIRALKLTKGDPVKILYSIGLLAAFMTVFLTTIPTAIILGTLIMKISRKLNFNLLPYILLVGMMVNIGGLLTPISSLPNIMITSSIEIGFVEFTWFMFPVWIILVIITLLFFRIMFRNQLVHKVTKEELKSLMAMDENEEIKDKKLFKRSIIILSLIILFFFLQDITGIGKEAIALTGAILMLLLSSADPEQVFSKVQWSTLAFFAGLFIVIGGIEHVGLLEKFTVFLSQFMQNAFSSSIITMFISSVVSSIVDNVPVTAILIPVARSLTTMFSSGNLLFYAIALGATLGGNLTPIGSPSNIIVLHMAEKHKIHISFGEFMKIGGILTTFHLIVSSIYFAIVSF